MRHLFLLCLAVAATQMPLRADEGMWTYNNFPSEQVKQRYGFQPDAAWLERTRLSSVRFGGGCSASFVSGDGLVMTNHHCARSCIANLSTKQKDYNADGFYAKSEGEELRCPALEVNQLVGITDVTNQVTSATAGKTGEAFNDAQKAIEAKIEKACATDDKVTCEVVTLYNGGKYDLYKYRRYEDVRLVFAPEEKIAFFGGDPDNFNFPRYDLDVTFVRAYENGQPAKTPNHFKWSAAGAKEGELTFVSGHPGRTEREKTVAQMEYTRDYSLPAYVAYMSEYRGMVGQFQTRGAEQARISNDLLFGIENSLKVMKGRQEALVDKAAFAKRVAREQELRNKINADPKLKAKYGRIWDEIELAVKKQHAVDDAYMYLENERGLRSKLFTHARRLVRAAEELPKANEKRLPEFADSKLPQLKQAVASKAPIYKELEVEQLTFALTKLREVLGPDDESVRALFGKRSPREIATEAVNGTKLIDPALRKQLFEGGKAAVDASSDSMIQFAKQVDVFARQARSAYEREVESVLKKNGELLGRARFDVYGTSIYPDATFTLRLSYGAVKGWEENGKKINPMTIIGGAFERHTGRDPFALPDSWLAAKPKLNQATPFNFVTTNDIIGGNSGSPIINQKAEVVGIIFDGNIHSLGGDYWFDETMNRAVSVHSSAIIEALNKVYGAKRVIDELRPPQS